MHAGVCETELLHLSSLTMNSLLRGQLHHCWTWANCLNAGKYTGKYPPTTSHNLAHIHTHCPPLLARLTKENLTTEGVFCSPITNVPRWTATTQTNRDKQRKPSNCQSGFEKKVKVNTWRNIWKNSPSMWKAVGQGHTWAIHKAMTYIHS